MENPEAHKQAVLISHLTKKYGKVTAVDNISLQVPYGEFFGYLGTNGAGKTTTIKVLAGLLPATYERIEIDGVSLKSEPLSVKARIGLMPEEPHLYERLNGYEFLEFVGGMYGLDGSPLRRRVLELMDLMDLAESGAKLIIDYSKGMRKKIALAAAIIHQPRVLFLDEPFAGIDTVTAHRLKDILRAWVRAGVTIFFSSHIMEVVEKLCTSFAIIHQGRVVYQDVMASVLARQDGKSLEDIFIEVAGTTVRDEPTEAVFAD
ncbi:MAG: hypothetical protein B1H03_01720 [Planctomycetales bacterium 4484_113]|nr:MAG: hypothetical protein B1H03_01720 [Planctomycetales bacterium 4484_113]